ncbi:hypothetical protein N7474_004010 [Penicillium riverlandense]|uniref:uncharacterized protein n=1 Tax=Penicillium riverlandense TaxID=1903569 RepID=UPI0025479708|nr:uncharacterized protein N7474_004010 [Penicillium riverlandense]KAJ5818419.1 hypothetical protein N7474_004010 [Penicillium riverlandense]
MSLLNIAQTAGQATQPPLAQPTEKSIHPQPPDKAVPQSAEPPVKRLKLTFNRGGDSPQSLLPPQTQPPSYTQPTFTTTPKPVRNTTSAPRGRRRGGASLSGKRKRADEDIIKTGPDSSSENSDHNDEADFTPSSTQTRSGRAVNRPTAYTSILPSPQKDPSLPKKATTTSTSISTGTGTGTGTNRKRKHFFRRKDANIVCIHCQRGSSPSTNTIVFCDECNAPWHQRCHDPPIADEVVLVKSKEWSCHECKPVPRPTTRSDMNQNQKKKMKQTQPAQPLIIARSALQFEVGGYRFTAAERWAYLSSLSHASLVELLVTISDKNPTIPMFPANMNELRASEFVYQPKTAPATDSTLTERGADSTETPSDLSSTYPATSTRRASVPVNQATSWTAKRQTPSRRTSAPTKPTPTNSANDPLPRFHAAPETSELSVLEGSQTKDQSSTPVAASIAPSNPEFHVQKPAQTEDDDEDFEEVEDHRLYPRAGNGFRPPLDPADLDILREDPECTTFSHALHGPAKNAQKPVQVWGMVMKG